MRTIGRRLLGVLLSRALVPFALSACSLASGVGDLQGGAPPKVNVGVDSGVADASIGVGEDASVFDASNRVDAVVPAGDGLVCGATRCQAGDSCCVDLGARTATCANGKSCGGGTMTFDCGRTSDCTASDDHDVCCWAPVNDGAICSRRCDGPASKVLCDPNDSNPCPDGMTCAADAVLSPYMSCR